MATPTWQLNGIWSFLVELQDDKPARSSFLLASPIAYFLAHSLERGRLGTPKIATVLGGKNMPTNEVKAFLNGAFRDVRYQRSEANDGRTVQRGESTPTASNASTDQLGKFVIGRTEFNEPYYILKADLDACTSATHVRMQTEFAYDKTVNSQIKRLHRYLWSGGVTSSPWVTDGSRFDMNDYDRQQASPWGDMLGLQYVVGTQNNIYGSKDRTTETVLNSFTVAATDTGFSSSTLASLAMIDKINIGYTNSSSVVKDGMAFRNPNGIGCNLVVCRPDLFHILRDEAEGFRSVVYSGKDIPDAPITGYNYPVIQHGRVFISPDPLAPSGVLVMLSSDNCMLETDPKANMTFSKPVPKWQYEEGGEKKLWGNSELGLRFLIDNPALCGTVTGVTTS